MQRTLRNTFMLILVYGKLVSPRCREEKSNNSKIDVASQRFQYPYNGVLMVRVCDVWDILRDMSSSPI